MTIYNLLIKSNINFQSFHIHTVNSLMVYFLKNVTLIAEFEITVRLQVFRSG